MKPAYFACLFLFIAATDFGQSNHLPDAPQPDPKTQARILDQYGKLPLSFEANLGQTDARVKFFSHTSRYALFLTGNEAVLALHSSNPKTNEKILGIPHTSQTNMAFARSGTVLRMKLRNSDPEAKVTGEDELAGTNTYFIGNDPKNWRSNVPTYAKVRYEGIYSGIDLVYYGNQRQFEYDFIVAPGADPHRIAFDVHGAKRIRQDELGDLIFEMGQGEVRWHRPVVYQEKDGKRQEIEARYAITDRNRVGFVVAGYDLRRSLYIDPLIYSTYLGGSGEDVGFGVAVDSDGNAYVTGATASANFPVTPGALQTTYGAKPGYPYAFVTKINPSGSALVYSTYLGGNILNQGFGIAVDSLGNAYVTGDTEGGFPVTPGAFQTTCPLKGTENASFVAKLDSTGSALVYSTYLCGSGGTLSTGIAVDNSGNAYVTGYTVPTDFPVTPGAFQTTSGSGITAFVTALNPSGSAAMYSTFLGGSGESNSLGIAVDSWGDAYVTGYSSTGFPVTPHAFQTNCCGAFVTKFNATGSALVYSTFLGGSGDYGNGVAVDSVGNAYVTGHAGSDFPVTPGAFQPTYGGGQFNAFVTKINPSGSALVYSTFLGGSGFDQGTGIAVDSAGNAYVSGYTGSTNFPVTPGAFQAVCNGGSNCATYADAFVSKLNPAGSALIFSTYLGGRNYEDGYGIAVDRAGNAYVTGDTKSGNFPITPSALQRGCKSCVDYADAFVTKMYFPAATTIALRSSPNPSAYGQAVSFTGVVTSGIGAPPNGETVTFKKGSTILGAGTLSGGTATLSTSTLGVGTSMVTAVYGGDANFASTSSKSLSQVIAKATTTTKVVSSKNPSNFGQSVTFTATVAPQFGGLPTGTVTFKNGTATLKTAALSGGVARFTSSALVAGTHDITADYNGSLDFITSSASLIQTVK
jgi:hypothetical protein